MPARRFRLPAATLATLPAMAVLAAACVTAPVATTVATDATPGATQVVPPTPSSASPAATPSAAASLPPGVLGIPTAFAADLPPGRYLGSPPFEVPLTFEVLEPGWVVGHRGAAFLDMQRFEGEPGPGITPIRVIGFGHADRIRGEDGDVPILELTPRAAVELLAGRSSLDATHVRDLDLVGLPGARVDLHSEVGNNPVFGLADGTFGLGPELDLRLVVLPLDGDLLLLTVMAPPGELEAAWDEALPVLGTVDLQP